MIRDITIHAVLNGFTVRCGCHTLVYTDVPTLLRDIEEYLNRPDDTEKRILAKAINRKHMEGMMGEPVGVPCPPAYADLASGVPVTGVNYYANQPSEGCANP